MIIGLDLSLRAAAVCSIPEGWGQNLDSVQTRVVGLSLETDADVTKRVERLQVLSNGIIKFIRDMDTGGFTSTESSIKAVYLEDYAFAAFGAHVRSVAEFTGVVKWRLYDELDITVRTVAASRARKVLLQKCPAKAVKKFVVANVKRLGGKAETWTDDEIDAFVCANYGVMDTGGVAMTFEGTHEKANVRRRGARQR